MESKNDDLFGILRNLETILQTETKKSRPRSPKRSPPRVSSTYSQKILTKKKLKNVGAPMKHKMPRKLYNNDNTSNIKISAQQEEANRQIIQSLTPKKYERKSKSSPLRSKSVNGNTANYKKKFLKSKLIKTKLEKSIEISQNLSSNQLNTLCIFFLRWMKRCTEKIEINSKQQQIPKPKVSFVPPIGPPKSSSNVPNSKNKSTKFNITDDSLGDLNLEETSPLPETIAPKKVPSIVESDFNNPNSADFHYDSYEVSDKSLSLLPPQGEGDVTEFIPSRFK